MLIQLMSLKFSMKTVQHKFVEFIPDHLNEGVLYISLNYCTAIHKCVCGCGNEVVTPFSPTDWSITFNGKSVTLRPSIGNWNFECRSHYFITQNKIERCRDWTNTEIAVGRNVDKENKANFYSEDKLETDVDKFKSKVDQSEGALKRWSLKSIFTKLKLSGTRRQ